MPSFSLTLSEFALACGGVLRHSGRSGGDVGPAVSSGAPRVRAVLVDSRRLVRPDAAFFALQGKHADGHRFVAEALDAGCVTAVVAEDRFQEIGEGLPEGSSVVVVPVGSCTGTGWSGQGAEAPDSRRAFLPDGSGGAGDPVLAALERLASWWRGQLRARVLGITGSNGKTTVKSALFAVLSRRYRVAASPGSWNSRLGVALSLLGVEDDAEVALIEAGVSEPGDMEPLRAMIRPDLGMLTSIGTAHIGAFGDKDAIGREKLSLFKDLPKGSRKNDFGIRPPIHPGGLRCSSVEYAAVFALLAPCPPGASAASVLRTHSFASPNERGWLLLPDDPRCLRLAESLSCPLVLFGPGAPESSPVAVTRRSTTRGLGQILRLRFDGRVERDLEVWDTSPAQVQNVAAAACAGALLGVPPVDIVDALDGFRPPPQRMETWQTQDGVTIINDCYSADPDSTDAALRALSSYPAERRRIFVFGGMAGLGTRSAEEHEHVGRLAGSVGVSLLVTVGKTAVQAAEVFDGAVHRAQSPAEAVGDLSRRLRHGDVVLVKGPTEKRLDSVARALVESSAPTRMLVNLSAVEANLRQIRRLAGPHVRLCPIVKAEAYGGDPVRLSRFLERVGVDALGVAFAEEGVTLRRAGIGLPILVLSPGRLDAERLVRHRLTPVVHATSGLADLEEAAARLGRPVAIHLKVDTGMGRYGFFPGEVLPVARRVTQGTHLYLEGLMTHFAAAEDPDEDAFTRAQINAFGQVVQDLREAGIEVPVKHAAATAAALRFPEAHHDLIRVGLGLYGISPSRACQEALPLECAVAVVSRIASIKTFPPGHSIGYGRRYRVGSEARRIAFIPCGYHDAVWRDLYQGGGEVLVRGVRCPIVGTVSMDSAPIDISGVPEADIGDDVLLFGAWQGQLLPPEEVAARAGTVAHELLSGIGPRVPRIYEEG